MSELQLESVALAKARKAAFRVNTKFEYARLPKHKKREYESIKELGNRIRGAIDCGAPFKAEAMCKLCHIGRPVFRILQDLGYVGILKKGKGGLHSWYWNREYHWFNSDYDSVFNAYQKYLAELKVKNAAKKKAKAEALANGIDDSGIGIGVDSDPFVDVSRGPDDFELQSRTEKAQTSGVFDYNLLADMVAARIVAKFPHQLELV